MRKIKYIFSFSICLLILSLSSICFALSPSSNKIYEGIDVSNWQGYINYSEVKASGIDIVYIKASQGENITDSHFKTNYNNAKINGLKVGLYHFLTALLQILLKVLSLYQTPPLIDNLYFLHVLLHLLLLYLPLYSLLLKKYMLNCNCL